MKILIIDDDTDVVDFIKTNLRNNSYTVDSAYDGEGGSYMARTGVYDVVIIDYSLPDKNGLIVCSEIRSTGSTCGIIFLSMNYTVKNKVACLEAGADDYMIKPFSLEELNARIKALARRPKKIESNILTCGDILIDTKKQSVQRGGRIIYLTRTEYDVLEFLMKNKGMVLSRGMIMEHVWNAEVDPFSNTIEAHITNIRKKLSQPEDTIEIIRNIAGRGYIIDL